MQQDDTFAEVCSDWPGWTPSALSGFEWWTLMAPKKRQHRPIPRYHDKVFSPPHLCIWNTKFDAFKLLCNSPDAISIETNAPTVTPRGQTGIEQLPAELLAAIFRLLNPDDFIAFSLCSQALWMHAIQRAKNGYTEWKKTYSLAGTPIMYVGSHLKVLPEFVYDKYPDLIPEETPQEIRDARRMVTRTTAAFNKAVLEFDQTPLPYDDAYMQSFTKYIANADIPAGLHDSIKASFPTFGIEQGSKWLLRNLTKNEFIRMEAINTTTLAHIQHSWLTLDTLLYWLICWRGNGHQQILDWENLEDFIGATNQARYGTWRGTLFQSPYSACWPIWSGNWAGHSLEVVADRNLDEGWIDRTSKFDQLAPKLLQTMYAFALTQGDFKPKRYWEEVFEQLGDVVDQETEYEHDGKTWTETHKTIVSLRVHATALCGCTS
ncbi:uncharacterized protein B0J16DRAFT_165016 [Fusarium flagelliforme]|uniref:uncharacterized protein n=1 Tax=Fusarium flagelliforme TaxID=2675880 RepID=UPI001E8CC8A9|nr:uncharacterized protein B0J16DRAFT_165016 [Fusarium flagelliforme]KAH7183532.1 hypothetical protein B0J16DRAFT_165016 [Fusarium flagelliforme]